MRWLDDLGLWSDATGEVRGGRLTFSPDSGAEIRLPHGFREDDDPPAVGDMVTYSVLLGELDDEGPVAALECRERIVRHRYGRIGQSVEPRYLVVGDSPLETAYHYRAARVVFEQSALWGHSPSSSIQSDFLDAISDDRTVTYSVAPPVDYGADGTRASVRIVRSTPPASPHRGELRLAEQTFIELTPRAPVDVTALVDDYVRPVQGLLSILTGTAARLLAVMLQDASQSGTGFPLELIYRHLPRGRDTSAFQAYRIPFPLAVLGPSAATTFARWLDWYADHRDLIDLYLSAMYYSETGAGFRLLAACATLEGLHRSTSSGGRWSKAEFRDRRTRVLDAVADDDREWVKEATRHANQRSLASRIEALVVELPDDVGRTIFRTHARRESVTRSIVARRNELAHGRADTLDQSELEALNEYAGMLVESLVLHRCGLYDLDPQHDFTPFDDEVLAGLSHTIDMAHRWNNCGRLDNLAKLRERVRQRLEPNAPLWATLWDPGAEKETSRSF